MSISLLTLDECGSLTIDVVDDAIVDVTGNGINEMDLSTEFVSSNAFDSVAIASIDDDEYGRFVSFSTDNCCACIIEQSFSLRFTCQTRSVPLHDCCIAGYLKKIQEKVSEMSSHSFMV